MHDCGEAKSPGLCPGALSACSSQSVVTKHIYHPMTSYHPLQKNVNVLAVAAERQSLCVDVIFQSNNS